MHSTLWYVGTGTGGGAADANVHPPFHLPPPHHTQTPPTQTSPHHAGGVTASQQLISDVQAQLAAVHDMMRELAACVEALQAAHERRGADLAAARSGAEVLDTEVCVTVCVSVWGCTRGWGRGEGVLN